MSRIFLGSACTAWAAVTALGIFAFYHASRIDEAPPPSAEVRDWALDALERSVSGKPPAPVPDGVASYRAPGPILARAWFGGRPVGWYASDERAIADAVATAGRSFRLDPRVRARAVSGDLSFTLTFTLGEGPLLLDVPLLSPLSLVPLREGLAASYQGRRAWLTPSELQAQRTSETGIDTPIPDLRFGANLQRLVDQLARELGVSAARLRKDGKVWRFRASTATTSRYPRSVAVRAETLRNAAREGAEFLLRHQRPSGRFTYIYDGGTGLERPAAYNLARHAGTAYFLAQIARVEGFQAARSGALRALRWLREAHVRRCGSPNHWCVAQDRQARVGPSALTALAAAELLRSGDQGEVRALLVRLTAFLRSMQRPDGELMHEYDLGRNRPVDVQHLYYSGEAALALLLAHQVTGDERNVRAARRLMRHLTGAGWSFFGSRYFYGEEHWTCMAAAEALKRLGDRSALDFCRRWVAFNERLQVSPGQTPWRAEGAYGVGPVLLPRITPVASRTEAAISVYEMSRLVGIEDAALRRQIERGLGMLLRWRWAPGPVHLLREPEQARGGIPGDPSELTVRNDYVQHAASAMLRWAEVLERSKMKTRDD